MAIERDELRLVWQTDLFSAEARALLATRYASEESLGYLLDEAFADGQALARVSDDHSPPEDVPAGGRLVRGPREPMT